jgi:hypothetical protein
VGIFLLRKHSTRLPRRKAVSLSKLEFILHASPCITIQAQNA